VLCTRNQIVFDPQKDTAPSLLDKALPRSTLDTGTFKEPLMAVARMRNRLSSSHGGGTSVRKVERHVARTPSRPPPPPSFCLCRTWANDASVAARVRRHGSVGLRRTRQPSERRMEPQLGLPVVTKGAEAVRGCRRAGTAGD
jgi:hypothetical protein